MVTGTAVAIGSEFNKNSKKMLKLTQKTTKAWLLTLAASLFTGFGMAGAQDDPAPTPVPATEPAPAPTPDPAPAEEEEKAMDFETILKKSEEFAAETKKVKEANKKIKEANKGKSEEEQEEEKPLPDWGDYVSGDADTVWGTITDALGDEKKGEANKEALNGLSAEANQAIYDNVWSSTSNLVPWLTHNIWVLIAAFLVFIMHLGFCTLESGLCQKKNTVNILFKNCWIISIGILTYYLWGFNAHYPGWEGEGFFAMGSPASYSGQELLTHATDLYNPSYTWWTDFIFQAMFAATAATIVSGAVAERVKLTSFMVFSVLLVGIAYPWAGSWHWGLGFLNGLGFYDFAGSTVVHAFGGFAALACVIVLGPRAGKYTENGVKPILGHSLPLAAIGVFLLFFGWFGFNGGSVLAAEPHSVSLVITTTSLAAVGGAIGSIVIGWGMLKKPDLSMALNGFLAGLVGITAGPDVISPNMSILVGFIAGALVVVSILFFDKIKIDDPVGAISVHGVCGIWGTLAAGIFGEEQSVMVQLIGIVSVCAFAFVFSFVVFFILKMVMGVRVDAEEEAEGLDVAEHGAPAYAE